MLCQSAGTRIESSGAPLCMLDACERSTRALMLGCMCVHAQTRLTLLLPLLEGVSAVCMRAHVQTWWCVDMPDAAAIP